MGAIDIKKELKKYLSGEDERFVVSDVKNVLEEKDVEWLFILESPHEQEVKKNKPLMGGSGKDVSKFLGLGDKAFGEIIEDPKMKNKIKVAIINVSQVPLQKIEMEEDNKTDDFYKELKKIRDQDPIDELKTSFADRIKKYEENPKLTIVVCGEFASKYFDEYILNADENKLLRRQYNDEIRILFVPHPSRHQWSFIEKHKENLTTLKELFNQSIGEK